MVALKLSTEEALIKWAAWCVDWFMNLFADPEYYWVEETYPYKNNTSQGEVLQDTTTVKTKEVVVGSYIKKAIEHIFTKRYLSIVLCYKTWYHRYLLINI